jgi:hypothetical protein
MHIRGFDQSLLTNAETVPQSRPPLAPTSLPIHHSNQEAGTDRYGLCDGRPVNLGSTFAAARDLLQHHDDSWSATSTDFCPMRKKEPFPGVKLPKREPERSPPSTITPVNE